MGENTNAPGSIFARVLTMMPNMYVLCRRWHTMKLRTGTEQKKKPKKAVSSGCSKQQQERRAEPTGGDDEAVSGTETKEEPFYYDSDEVRLLTIRGKFVG